MSTIFELIEAGNIDDVKNLVRENPDLIDEFGDGNALYRDKTPLMYALQNLNGDLAKSLINLGADVNAKMRGGQLTPVINFSISQFINTTVVERLLNNGCDPNQCDFMGECPLKLATLAVLNKEPESWQKLDLLLRSGADWDYIPEVSDREGVPISPREYAKSLKTLLPERLFDLM